MNLTRRITAIGSYPVCAIYRLEIPLRAMIARSWCSGNIYGAAGICGDKPTPESLDFSPGNPLLTQRQMGLDASTINVLHANGCLFIHDIDDLLWAIPVDNPGASELSGALLAKMDTSLRLADLVTASTQPLAAALERRGIPAVIIPNLLDPIDWRIMPKRVERSRLRVGWYGQRGLHIEDLNIIEEVVSTMARDVDFVFYGDLPERLRSRALEFEHYTATAMELFPAMLAMLDLDILLSPLAKNEFNECKSNLRLLQAGILGYAAIATDIEPHRKLPVTLVENTSAAWAGAISERVGEIDAVRAEGRLLQRAVNERYTLDDAWAETIFTTWTRTAPPETIEAP